MKRSSPPRRKKPFPKAGAQLRSQLGLAPTEFRRSGFPAAEGEAVKGSSGRRAPLAPRSLKRAGQEQKYGKLRKEFLAEHPWCQRCGQPATEIQHRRGRNGKRLLDVDWWAASCHACNMWAEEHTGEALAEGWLVRVNGTAA